MLLDLPTEISANILSYLCVKDLATCRLVAYSSRLVMTYSCDSTCLPDQRIGISGSL